jgi:hypothetical protein
MAIADSNTFLTYDAVGNREDLSPVIYNVAPYDTPFLTGVDRADAEAVTHEWQTDTLAPASGSNQALEGDDASTDAATPTVRLSNTCQISDKVPRVSGTQQKVKKAGRKDEMAYQVVKRAKELRNDMETSLLANTAKVAGDESTARKLAGIETWIATNALVGAGSGAVGGSGTTARTAGTNRDFTEDLLKTVIRKCYNEGGNPDCVMLPAYQKQVMSGFTGNATRMIGAEDRELVAAIDIYKSDFGDLEVVPNRRMVANSVLVLEKMLWAVAYLRPVQINPLAKTGDSERKQLITEFTLEARNEKGSGAIFDTNNS